jgi:hypothetical protein
MDRILEVPQESGGRMGGHYESHWSMEEWMMEVEMGQLAKLGWETVGMLAGILV